jgi:hypothetical protein
VHAHTHTEWSYQRLTVKNTKLSHKYLNSTKLLTILKNSAKEPAIQIVSSFGQLQHHC